MCNRSDDYWRKILLLLRTTCNPGELTFHYGPSIGERVFQELTCIDADNHYLIMSHSISEEVLRRLRIGKSNVICAVVDGRERGTAPEWVSFIESTRVFHPKLYIMLRGDICTCVVGSANLTVAGLQRNYESLLVINANSGSSCETKSLVYNMIHSFSRFMDLRCVIEKLPSWLPPPGNSGTSKRNSLRYLDNLQHSLLEGIFQFHCESTLKSCVAFSPVYANEGILLTDHLSRVDNQGVFETFMVIDSSAKPDTMHAKIVLFEFSDSSAVFIGSPNASLSSFNSRGFDAVENGVLISTEKVE